ncbi:TetR/AcrR family transcriptional regulator [Sinosporangium siamense]|uniref:TetR family transcriptional regulator n=1 Tax=Sinosporangium siamense TaxID=1367973 RepID=A0A919RLL0_9ACTN|nr:TetR/AcrR family transcriptional regulator [Sinosporangium siamense]GII96052.1 TetR family transcriptional regulator [Sinosporangium siamense]
MSKANDQISKGEVTRARLRQAALELIAEVGWRGVSTRLIADRAGLRVGLVHYHFDSLTALLIAAVVPLLDGLNDEVDQALHGVRDLGEGMSALTGPMERFTPESRLFIEVSMEAARNPEVAEAVAPALARARAVLAGWLTGIGHGRGAADLAAAVMAACDGLVLHRLVDPELDSHAAMARLAEHIERET